MIPGSIVFTTLGFLGRALTHLIPPFAEIFFLLDTGFQISLQEKKKLSEFLFKTTTDMK